MTRTTRILASAAILLLALTGCGEDPEVAAPAVTPAPADEPADEPAAPTPTPADADPDTDPDADAEDPATEDVPDARASVGVASTDLGEVLVDGEGRTLYMFEPDDQGAPTCDDECAAAWPPLTTDGDPTADGVDEALLGTAERTDGAEQVTVDGWPLYRWAGDDAPGDVNGQGVNDVWWVVAPDGTPIRDGDGDGEDADGGGAAAPDY